MLTTCANICCDTKCFCWFQSLVLWYTLLTSASSLQKKHSKCNGWADLWVKNNLVLQLRHWHVLELKNWDCFDFFDDEMRRTARVHPTRGKRLRAPSLSGLASARAWKWRNTCKTNHARRDGHCAFFYYPCNRAFSWPLHHAFDIFLSRLVHPILPKSKGDWT